MNGTKAKNDSRSSSTVEQSTDSKTTKATPSALDKSKFTSVSTVEKIGSMTHEHTINHSSNSSTKTKKVTKQQKCVEPTPDTHKIEMSCSE